MIHSKFSPPLLHTQTSSIHLSPKDRPHAIVHSKKRKVEFCFHGNITAVRSLGNTRTHRLDYGIMYAHISTDLTSAQHGLSFLHSLWWALHNLSDLEYLNVAGNRRITGQVSLSKPYTVLVIILYVCMYVCMYVCIMYEYII